MTAESLTLAASSERTFAGSMTCGGIGRGHPRYRSPRYYIMCSGLDYLAQLNR